VAWCYVAGSLRCAQAAFLLERQQAAADAQAMLLWGSELLRRSAAGSLERADEYLVAALAYKCASACAMRAFRLKQRDCARTIRLAREEIAALAPAAQGGGGAPEMSLSVSSAGRLEGLLNQLQLVCTMVEDHDKAQSMRRALVSEVSDEQRALLPRLDGASPVALSAQETLELLQALQKAVESLGGKATELKAT